MATFNTEAPSPYAPSVPRIPFSKPIYPQLASMRPPMEYSLPVYAQHLRAQLNHVLDTNRLDRQTQKLSNQRITEVCHQIKARIREVSDGLCTLENYLPTNEGKPLLRGIYHALQSITGASHSIKMHANEVDCYLGLRSQQDDSYHKLSQFATTMRNQIPTNTLPPFDPKKYEASSSECASVFEQGQEVPEVTESSASSAPSSRTFGSGCRGLGDALSSQRSETAHPELCISGEALTSISEENQKSATACLPTTNSHLASGEVQDDLCKDEEDTSDYSLIEEDLS
ncbi:hypothetical protein FVEG_06988 [Fusarium verticillioides 7600]|uniref:Uncharacterized protein n=1 Tax=Gibberella moniliformis (strain M3125 / FGSC 7600) TaxID=334819 RepID=W7MPI6_GIBM7|nr:hypothetical protein FVEG_06988 [Fusarium verticillioides 7600]EWG46537.1 hypothetical protein FVEG_06988 [Fusarium verticillioides 7600]